MEIEEARKELKHLLESKAFENARTHRRLLEFLATKTLAGETEDLKEYTIGVEAFGKPSTYDPQEDSIVRTLTGRLRLKLLEYYRFEGKDDPVLVEIPKGGFKLEFYKRENVKPIPAGANDQRQPLIATEQQRKTSFAWVLCAVMAIVCILLGSALWWALDRIRVNVPWPLSRVVNSQQQTTIVLADAVFTRLRYLNGRHASLEEYLSPEYPKVFEPSDLTPRESKLLEQLTNGPLVSSVDAENVKTIMALSTPLNSKIEIRSARDLRPRDLVNANSIFLGSPVANPWVSRFYGLLNFQEVDDLGEGNGKYFVNKNPRPGESKTYEGLTRTGDNGWAYATVAVLPNERWNGSVMILQGLHREGTTAAALFLADEQNRVELRRVISQANANPDVAWFEALIRAESIAAVPGKIQIVAVRIIHVK